MNIYSREIFVKSFSHHEIVMFHLPRTPLPILQQTPLQILPWTAHPNLPRIIRRDGRPQSPILPRTLPPPLPPPLPPARTCSPADSPTDSPTDSHTDAPAQHPTALPRVHPTRPPSPRAPSPGGRSPMPSPALPWSADDPSGRPGGTCSQNLI